MACIEGRWVIVRIWREATYAWRLRLAICAKKINWLWDWGEVPFATPKHIGLV